MPANDTERSTMTSMNAKLDLLLKNQADNELKLSDRLTAIDNSLKELNKLPKRVEQLESFQSAQTSANADLAILLEERDQRINALELKFINLNEANEKEATLKQLYDRRLNLLLHGIPDKAWETPQESKVHVVNFLKNILKLNDADNMGFVDVHRLPANRINAQRSEDEKRKRRPIVFKLHTIADRKKIRDELHLLEKYNENKPRNEKVSVSIHLPRNLQLQRKALVPEYVKQLKAGKKVMIKVNYDTAEMVIADKSKRTPKAN